MSLYIRVLAPFAAGFYLSNYYRFVNAVMSPRLVHEFDLSASELGLLTSIYFFMAAIFQAPLGLLMDRYGPRRVQAVMMAGAAVGVLIFALATDTTTLLIGRIVMGIGAAGGLMTSFQAIILWFSTERRPLLNGCIMSVGGLGALSATLPTEFLLHVTDWRHVMVAVSAASFAVSALVFLAVPDKPGRSKPSTLADQIGGLLQVYRTPFFWRIAPLYAVTIGAMFAFQSLWAGPWLKDVAHLPLPQIATDLLVVNVLQIACYIAIGWIGMQLGRRGISFVTIVAVGSALFILSQTGLVLPDGRAHWLVLLGMGCLANVTLLLYPALAERFPPQIMGRANTALNLFVFVGAFGVQYAVGLLIDLMPPLSPGTYPPAAYQFAFGLMVAGEALAWLWFVRPRTSRRGEPAVRSVDPDSRDPAAPPRH
jgi:predicted MFS family arabinose efflux permease